LPFDCQKIAQILTFFSKKLSKIFIFFKKIDNGNFFGKMKIFENFLTVKWQFPEGQLTTTSQEF